MDPIQVTAVPFVKDFIRDHDGCMTSVTRIEKPTFEIVFMYCWDCGDKCIVVERSKNRRFK